MTTKKTLLTTAFALALSALAVPAFAITTHEIADMGKAGVSDDLIISMVQASPTIPTLTPQDVIMLKESGVGDAVVHYVLNYRAEREDAFQYDQAIRRQMLMNFEFPAGYFDTTYSGQSRGYGGSLTPLQFGGYGAGFGGGMPGYGLSVPPLGFGYYPDYLRTDTGNGELNLNLGGSNTGALYDEIKWDDLWTWNFALYGAPPASRLYFRN